MRREATRLDILLAVAIMAVVILSALIVLSVNLIKLDVKREKGLYVSKVDASVDYFALGCGELKDRINHEIDQAYRHSSTNMMSGKTGLAQVFLEIYQLKGCKL